MRCGFLFTPLGTPRELDLVMDAQTLIIFAVTAMPVIFAFCWWEYRSSGCAYGGSELGKDNWRLSGIARRIRETRKQWAEREPRDVSDI